MTNQNDLEARLRQEIKVIGKLSSILLVSGADRMLKAHASNLDNLAKSSDAYAWITGASLKLKVAAEYVADGRPVEAQMLLQSTHRQAELACSAQQASAANADAPYQPNQSLAAPRVSHAPAARGATATRDKPRTRESRHSSRLEDDIARGRAYQTGIDLAKAAEEKDNSRILHVPARSRVLPAGGERISYVPHSVLQSPAREAAPGPTLKAPSKILLMPSREGAVKRSTSWPYRLLRNFTAGFSVAAVMLAATPRAAVAPESIVPATLTWLEQPRIEAYIARPTIPMYAKEYDNLAKLFPIIYKAALSHPDVTPRMMVALSGAESGGDTLAISRTGAAGIAQFTYTTASLFPDYFRRLTPCEPKWRNHKRVWKCTPENDDRFDPSKALPAQAEYLQILHDTWERYSARTELVAGSYNGGPGTLNAAISNRSSQRARRRLGWPAIAQAVLEMPDLYDGEGRLVYVNREEIIHHVPRVMQRLRQLQPTERIEEQFGLSRNKKSLLFRGEQPYFLRGFPQAYERSLLLRP